MAPVGGWLAVSGSFSAVAWLLGAGVLMWVAGFDVIYACQDVEFDRREDLRSIPARFGVGPALGAARFFHLAALACLVGVGVIGALSPAYWVGMTLVALLLAWEHRLVRADDLSKIGVTFFNMNGVISLIYLATILAAVLLPRVMG
jgi:4-hydroxybenzoate polyprenyltransferase